MKLMRVDPRIIREGLNNYTVNVIHAGIKKMLNSLIRSIINYII